MLEKQRPILSAQLKNDLTDSIYLSSKLLSHSPLPARKEQMALFTLSGGKLRYSELK